MKLNRRDFVKIGSIATSGLVLKGNAVTMNTILKTPYSETKDELLRLSEELLQSWCQGILSLQFKGDMPFNNMQGGILCPSCARVHGRIGDVIYPFMYMADVHNDPKYLEASIKIFNWMEQNVSTPGGVWYNDVNVSQWAGTTIFGAIGLAEALKHHGHILDKTTYDLWKARLSKAAEFIYEDYDLSETNINYHAGAAQVMGLVGDFFGNEDYIARGKKLAAESMAYFSPNDTFLIGEGRPRDLVSPKGSYLVDLGYNVEESLPLLVRYAKLTNNQPMIEQLLVSLKTHAEFMLPDGAWDNSFGTRNYKWTYWGSRTADGCQPAYALLAEYDPMFYKVALENTKLLKACTADNLLYGGPHYVQHQIEPCVHHAMCHTKALAHILDNREYINNLVLPEKITLPREETYGVKTFTDINTWLVSKSDWRGTITGYDLNFHDRTGGHSTGGALTVLWNKHIGPVIAASTINENIDWEASNMQKNMDALQMPLTPRFELIDNNIRFTNICDFGSQISHTEANDVVLFTTKSSLVDELQTPVAAAPISCNIDYEFHNDMVVIKGSHNDALNRDVNFILPIISSSDEAVTVLSKQKISIKKGDKQLIVESNVPMEIMQVNGQKRVFNFVPGMEGLPIKISPNQFEIKLSVS